MVMGRGELFGWVWIEDDLLWSAIWKYRLNTANSTSPTHAQVVEEFARYVFGIYK